jgi:hypothetical protein
MTGLLSPERLTRRTAAFTLGLGGLAALLAHRPALTAQEATPVAGDVSRIGHPLLGAWQWMNLSALASDPAIGVFYPDGTYLTYETFEGVGIGFWRATGERTADLVVNYQTLAGAWQTVLGPVGMFEPDYAPTGQTLEIDPIITLALHITLDEALNTFLASGQNVVRNEVGDIVWYDSTVGQAVKLVEEG